MPQRGLTPAQLAGQLARVTRFGVEANMQLKQILPLRFHTGGITVTLGCAFQDHRQCYSDCRFTHTDGNATLTFDFSPLRSVVSLMNSPKFTSKGTKYFHVFNVSLCGEKVKHEHKHAENVAVVVFVHKRNVLAMEFLLPLKAQLAECRDNVTELSVSTARGEKGEAPSAVRSFICQSTIIPASGRGFHTALSSQSINLADTFLGK